jgi:cytoskeletal protein RodZ
MTSHHTDKEAKSAPAPTILSSYSEPEAPSQFRWPHGLILGFLLVLFVSLLGVGGWYLWRRPVTQTSQSSTSTPNVTTGNPPTTTEQPSPAITPRQANSASSADEEIEQLRDSRIGAKPSERVEIISALEQAEKNYPNDYRFPYELSKLSIKGSLSHDEAFEPLARAAQKAIDNGQADEMLKSFMADKNGDFHKLSHGHHEWEAIERALRNRDKGELKINSH